MNVIDDFINRCFSSMIEVEVRLGWIEKCGYGDVVFRFFLRNFVF